MQTHGMYGTPTYISWYSMLSRCRNPKTIGFANYGGKGITVSKRWYKFENFYIDMGHRPEGTSLERINNDRGYSKVNCRWATPKEQANNQTTSRFLRHKGKRQTVAQWADELGVSKYTLFSRLNYGWSVSKTLSQPSKQ